MEFESMRHLMEQRPEPGYAIYVTQALPYEMRKAVSVLEGEFVVATFTVSQEGHAVHEHTDSAVTKWSRWHLPIYTNGTVMYEGGVRNIMNEGAWYGPVKYWVPHSVAAPSKERVHLIVDMN